MLRMSHIIVRGKKWQTYVCVGKCLCELQRLLLNGWMKAKERRGLRDSGINKQHLSLLRDFTVDGVGEVVQDATPEGFRRLGNLLDLSNDTPAWVRQNLARKET